MCCKYPWIFRLQDRQHAIARHIPIRADVCVLHDSVPDIPVDIRRKIRPRKKNHPAHHYRKRPAQSTASPGSPAASAQSPPPPQTAHPTTPTHRRTRSHTGRCSATNCRAITTSPAPNAHSTTFVNHARPPCQRPSSPRALTKLHPPSADAPPETPASTAHRSRTPPRTPDARRAATHAPAPQR